MRRLFAIKYSGTIAELFLNRQQGKMPVPIAELRYASLYIEKIQNKEV